jgi:murein L,D-transpeptidase YafK
MDSQILGAYLPFRMTMENLNAHKDSKWFEFWENLKEGYDLFERNRRPPNVESCQVAYIFDER